MTRRLRSDPDKWARYFRVQRMIAQLDRVERQAAEKQRQRESEASHPDDDASRRPSRLNLAAKGPPRPGGHRGSSALKIFVFGSQSAGRRCRCY